jgi:dinuclear metal center YbgI/SA1388 family protein
MYRSITLIFPENAFCPVTAVKNPFMYIRDGIQTMTYMKIHDLLSHLEQFAPLVYQESYDNSGLLCGDKNAELKGALICLDSTEDVLDEAIRKNCNLIIAHHPILFTGIKKITGKNYVERCLIKAIKNDIAIYAIHTNLDNVVHGVNAKICEVLGLTKGRILVPAHKTHRKLVTFVPVANAEALREALSKSGAGAIGEYDSCSFYSEGTGTFKASDKANPFVGKKGELHREKELRLEMIYPAYLEAVILKTLRSVHPYEEPAFDLYSIENESAEVGPGMIAEFEKEMPEQEFLERVKTRMKAGCVRHTALTGKKIRKVAVCGGSGSFLLKDAISSGADAFVTADFKYHQFFDPDGKLLLADIGHYESEQFTKDLLFEVIREKFPTFAVHLSEIYTNPVNYL